MTLLQINSFHTNYIPGINCHDFLLNQGPNYSTRDFYSPFPHYNNLFIACLQRSVLDPLSRPHTINLYDGFVGHDDVVAVAVTSD